MFYNLLWQQEVSIGSYIHVFFFFFVIQETATQLIAIVLLIFLRSVNYEHTTSKR